jgi:uncharacterized repeat protein (TIGR01451 family)
MAEAKYLRSQFARALVGMAATLLPSMVLPHSVGQTQTTKFLAPETVQLLLARAGSGSPGFQAGDIVSYIVQFTPVANGSVHGAAGYVTDYVPPNTEVVDAAVVVPSGSDFVAVAPGLPGSIDNGWGNGQNTYGAPFNTPAFDSTGLCIAAGKTNNCNGSLAQVYADTGIFFSTDPRTAAFPAVPTRIQQGTNGYYVNPTAVGQLDSIVGNPSGIATTHNLWDAAMTNAFGSTALPGNTPRSSQPDLSSSGRGGIPFGAGSPVAGPQTGFPLDYTGTTGPWQRISYSGSRIGTRSTGPAIASAATLNEPTANTLAIKGAPTLAGWSLSPGNPLPAGTNAVRWAIGELVVGQYKFVKISLRLLAAPPPSGLQNGSEVWGGDAAGADDGKDNPWRYHVPSVADNNSNLFVFKQVVCVYSGVSCVPSDGGTIAPDAKVRYRITYLNSGAVAQTNVVLTDTLPPETGNGAVSNFVQISGGHFTGFSPAVPAAGSTITFTPSPIASLVPGAAGSVEFDVLTNSGAGDLVRNTARLVSDQVPSPGVTSVAVSNVANAANLVVGKTVTPGAIQLGDTVTYTITVTNDGEAAASNIVVNDFLPSDGGAAGTNNSATRFNFVNGSSLFSGIGAVTPTLTTPATVAPYAGTNREQVTWTFGALTLAAGASFTISFQATAGAGVPLLTGAYTNDVRVTHQAGFANAIATAPVYVGANLSGTVFEDVNYGGGAGRSLGVSSGVRVPGVRVELYDSGGYFVTAATTDASGNYSFNGLAAGSFTVRVVSATIRSTRPGGIGCFNCMPVQTFRTDASSGSAVADATRVGGEDPGLPDAGTNLTSATLGSLNTVSTVAQSVAPVSIGTANLTGVDFGFNFDTIVSTRDGGQGSLRQFIINSNALGGESGLAQTGMRLDPVTGSAVPLPAARESSIFMVPDGGAAPGLRGSLPSALTGGVALFTPATLLPAISGGNSTFTAIDGGTQGFNLGDNNAGLLGTGGTTGTDALGLSRIQRPEVQIQDGFGLPIGLDIQQSNTIVRGTSVTGFGNAGDSDNDADLRIGNSFTGTLIEGNVLGASAAGFADPGPGARSGGDHIRSVGGDNGTIRSNLIGFSAGNGIALASASNGWQLLSSEIQGNNQGAGTAGIVIKGGSGGTTIQANLISGNRGAGADTLGGGAGNALVNNSVLGNGLGGTQTAGIRFGSSSNTGDRNLIVANFGAGIMVVSGVSTNLLTRNSIYGNGTVGTPTNQIGIDLLSATDNQDTGSPVYVTPNDSGDSDSGGNGLNNYPILESMLVSGTNLTLSGFARPGSIIELFIAAPDGSGFGEGQTFIGSFVEGSGDDADTGSGTYGPAPINGIAQGTDTTNRFSFTLPLPAGVGNSTPLTATATIGGTTSEFSGNISVTLLPSLTVLKSSVALSDPLNGTNNPKRIPGGYVSYSILTTNSGPGSVDGNTTIITDPVPANTDLFVGDAGVAGSGPVIFSDGTPSSGLSYSFPASLTYLDAACSASVTPAPDGAGFASNVGCIRINLTGAFVGDAVQGAPSPNFAVSYRVRIE